jgi:hypothetical protein
MQAFYRVLEPVNIEIMGGICISMYIVQCTVNVNFFKIVAFYRDDQKIFK